jgi:UDP-glucose 4-epimerase
MQSSLLPVPQVLSGGMSRSRALIKAWKSRCLDDLSGGFEANVRPARVSVKGSILDDALIRRLTEETPIPIFIYHLGAYAAEGLSHFIRRYNYHNNLIGSINLINAAGAHEGAVFCVHL